MRRCGASGHLPRRPFAGRCLRAGGEGARRGRPATRRLDGPDRRSRRSLRGGPLHRPARTPAGSTARPSKRPPRAPASRKSIFATSIALELRKKDLGVLTAGPAADLDALNALDPALARYAPWLELVAGLPNKIKGSPGIDQTGGRTLDAQLDWIKTRVTAIDRELEEAAQPTTSPPRSV